MHDFTLEYQESTTLFAITYGVDTSLIIDELTIKRTLGHFASVQINLNMSNTRFDRILVEQEGYTFFVEGI